MSELKDNGKKQMMRISFVGKFEKLIRAARDDFLAEKGAVATYTSQIIESFQDLFGITLEDPLGKLDGINEQELVNNLTKVFKTELGMATEASVEMAKVLRDLLIGPLGTRGQPQYDKSIRHIALEEVEHAEEFTKMEERLQGLINYLKKAPYF